jgi:putative phosphoesterase
LRHAKVALRAGRFRFAAIADTHSKPHPATEQRLSEMKPDAILHAGDIGNLEVLDRVAKIAPVFAVRGNIDGRTDDVPDVLTIDVMDGTALELRLLLLHIAVYGPKLRADAARIARREGATLVVCGHSHVPFIGLDRGLTVFNPGSVGPRRFALPIVLGAIDIARRDIRLAHIDCETGKPWLPPGPSALGAPSRAASVSRT